MATQAAFIDSTPEEDNEIIATPSTRSARVKGTWQMYWGDKVFDFVDGQRYNLPTDLFDWLRRHDNIYDTIN